MNKCLVLTIQKLQRIIYNSQTVVILKIKSTEFYFSIGKTFTYRDENAAEDCHHLTSYMDLNHPPGQRNCHRQIEKFTELPT